MDKCTCCGGAKSRRSPGRLCKACRRWQGRGLRRCCRHRRQLQAYVGFGVALERMGIDLFDDD